MRKAWAAVGELPLSQTHYEVLQVHPAAPLDLVTAAYWRLAGQAQAARHGDASAEANLYQLTRSYQALADPAARAAYDRLLGLPPQSLVPLLPRRRKRSVFGVRFLRRRVGSPVDYYEVLRVHPAADAPMLAEAYAVMRNYYLRLVQVGSEPYDLLDWLEEAYAVTSDPVRRASYDESRAAKPAPPAATAAPARELGESEPSRPSADAVVLEPAPPVSVAAGPEPVTTPARVVVASSSEPGGVPLPPVSVVAQGLTGRLREAGSTVRVLTASLARICGTAALAGGGAIRSLPRLKRTVEGARRRPDGGAAGEEAFLHRLSQMPVPLAVASGARAVAELTLVEGPGRGASFEVRHLPLTLGGSELCDINLPGLAAEEARLLYREGRFVLFSLSESPGVQINGDPVTWSVLENGDSLGVGPYKLQFHLPAG